MKEKHLLSDMLASYGTFSKTTIQPMAKALISAAYQAPPSQKEIDAVLKETDSYLKSARMTIVTPK